MDSLLTTPPQWRDKVMVYYYYIFSVLCSYYLHIRQLIVFPFLFVAVFMFVLSQSLDSLLGEDHEGNPIPGAPPPNVTLITAIFFALNFLAATQDIAVDGWALTMLSRYTTSSQPHRTLPWMAGP